MGTILSCESIIKQYRQYDSVVTAVNRASFQVENKESYCLMVWVQEKVLIEKAPW